MGYSLKHGRKMHEQGQVLKAFGGLPTPKLPTGETTVGWGLFGKLYYRVFSLFHAFLMTCLSYTFQLTYIYLERVCPWLSKYYR